MATDGLGSIHKKCYNIQKESMEHAKYFIANSPSSLIRAVMDWNFISTFLQIKFLAIKTENKSTQKIIPDEPSTAHQHYLQMTKCTL